LFKPRFCSHEKAAGSRLFGASFFTEPNDKQYGGFTLETTQTLYFGPKDFPSPPRNPLDLPARVTEVQKDLYRIWCEHGEMWARPKGSLLREAAQFGALPTVGDFVYVQYEPQGHSLITELLPRRTKFSRPDETGKREQLIAANFDYVWIVTSLNYDFNIGRVERYLAAAWQSGAQPVALLTKADLCEETASMAFQVESAAPGVPVHAVSAVTGQGIDALEPYLRPGVTLALLGMSGVGKSSLINALLGEERLAVRAIREDDSRGRHTTTHRQLLPLPGGALVIDTPGMRELGLWAVDSGLDEVFADIEALAACCRFRDCAHQREPGCAILAALEDGTLEASRYASYTKLAREAARHADRQAAVPTWQRKQKIREFQKVLDAATTVSNARHRN